MLIKEVTCCFSGHRDLDEDLIFSIQEKLEVETRFLIRRGYINFIAGGALGFDTLAAKTVLQMRKEFDDIRLVLALPCPEQADKWDYVSQALYQEIKQCADEVVYVSAHYYSGCMMKRNRFMVDNSSCCIAYMKKFSGGTNSTIKYCYSQGVDVVNLVFG